MLFTVSPLSYLGNVLGANSILSALTVFATDYEHDNYKKAVIGNFKKVDKILPRAEEANKLILDIAKEIAYKYSAQIANVKDSESLGVLADVTMERMISYIFAQTSLVKHIKDGISNKINDTLKFIIGSD